MNTSRKEFEEIWQHRIENHKLNGKWNVYDLTVSEQTAQKFINRSRQEGFKIFMRDEKVGFMA